MSDIDVSGGSDNLPPLPADFSVPDQLIDYDLLRLQCELIYKTLIDGHDARPVLWALVKEEGDYVATLAVRFVYEPIGGFLFHRATTAQALATSRHLASLVVTAREIALRNT